MAAAKPSASRQQPENAGISGLPPAENGDKIAPIKLWRGQGDNVAAVESVWDRSTGNAYNVSTLAFSDKGISFGAWNAGTNLNLVLESGTWHEIVVEANGNSRSQELFIDGTNTAHWDSSGQLYDAGTIILGDTAGSAMHGLCIFDDVSLRSSTCPGADLALSISASPTTAVPGQQITFDLSVTNKGDLSASSVILTNIFPSNTAFVSATSSQGICTQSLGTVVCSLGNIGVGSNATVSVMVTPTATGLATNSAGVMAYEPDLNPTDNVASVIVAVVEGPFSEIQLYAGVTVYGLIGRTYGIQYTTDLNQATNWIGLTNITLTVPNYLWYDSQPASLPRRFYRALPGPISIP